MAKINGTSGADILDGTEFADQISGLGGDDQIDGSSDDDVIDGGDGNDWIQGGQGFDTIRGGAGDDIIGDGLGGGSYYGGDGADIVNLIYLYQVSGSVLIDGGNDNDMIRLGMVGPGLTKIVGGAGSDQVELFLVSDAIAVSLGTQRDVLSFTNSFRGVHDEANYLANAVTVSDFATGNGGDLFDPAYFWGTSLIGWDQSANPFGAGYARLVSSGTATLFQVDMDGGGSAYGYQTFLTLQNTSKSAFTAANFAGYAPNGSNVAGVKIVGNSAAENLVGTLGKDVMEGAGGDDNLKGGGGSDSMRGGDGLDYLYGEVGHDALRGDGGDDFLSGGVGNDQLSGGEGNDILVEDAGRNILDGAAGNDRLMGGKDDDTLLGGDGDDDLYEREGSNRLDAGAGNDRIDIYSLNWGLTQTVLGGSGNDLIEIRTQHAATADAFILDAGAGSDRIEVNGDSGPARFTLGTGFDTIALMGQHSGHDYGGFTVRDFQAGPAGEVVEWRDFLGASLIGWDLSSNVFAAGFARLTQAGSSTLLQIDIDGDDFGYGFVTLAIFENTLARDLTTENLDGFSPIAVRKGTGGANNMTGTSAGERIEGMAGNDTISARGGDDLLLGGAGNDVLNGEAGKDLHYGGTGNDVYHLENVGDRVLERAGEGYDVVHSLATFKLPDNVEELALRGTAATNGTGNDLANAITGNNAANRLDGGRGNDVIVGGAGNDLIYGNLGNDVLKGGVNADGFVFNTALGSSNVDRILDFSPNDDTIYLSRTVFAKAGANGALVAAAFHKGVAAADAGDRIVYDQAAGKIFYDPDGTGASAQLLFATVTAGTALTSADFVIYG